MKKIGVIAVDLGGTKLATALFSADGKMLGKSVALLGGRSGPAVGELVAGEIARRMDGAGTIRAVGISVPGIAWPQGTVWAPNIPGWNAYPLREQIQAAVGRRIPVQLENDRACYILGEAWKGAARGCANAIYLSVGTGIGAGILADGKVLRGADGIAGAAGWLALQRPFRAAYKNCGCLESHGAGPGLARAAKLSEAQELFDSRAGKKPLRLAVELWGMAAANLVSLFNPEKIIFGGGIFGPASHFLGDIRAEAEKWAQPLAMKRVRLEASALGGNAGLYGAAFIALRAEGKVK